MVFTQGHILDHARCVLHMCCFTGVCNTVLFMHGCMLVKDDFKAFSGVCMHYSCIIIYDMHYTFPGGF